MSTRRAPRGPVAVYGIGTVVMLIILATLALTSRQPSPPAIAEFAPQARRPIRQAPQQLSSSIGSANGSPGGGGLPTTTTQLPPTSEAAPPPINVPSVHRCYGDPPRQISFDTQSPPCIAYWQGDNGGATSRGVTGNEIKVALLSNGGDTRAIQDLETFFNRTFEFYGRHLKLDNQGQGPKSSYSGDSCIYQRTVADEMGAAGYFATTDPNTSADACFLDEAAADKMITVSGTEWFTSATLASRAPYLWQYEMGYDQEMAILGRAMCANLVGKNADFTHDPVLRGRPRKFGMIMDYYGGEVVPSDGPLRAQLAGCGSGLAASTAVQFNENTNGATLAADYSQVAAQNKQATIQMQGAGVTTVVCLCLVFMEDSLGPAADLQQYKPEWIIFGAGQDLDAVNKVFWADPSQQASLMGMAFDPRQVPYAETTLNQAIAAVDPGYGINSNEATFYHNEDVYWMLLLLASGIQMAGPHLTPQTFAHALQTTVFPNPPSPQMEGKVAFGSGYSMTTDADLMWFSPNSASVYPDMGVGTWCYIDGRYTAANWPSTASPLFQPPCTS